MTRPHRLRLLHAPNAGEFVIARSCLRVRRAQRGRRGPYVLDSRSHAGRVWLDRTGLHGVMNARLSDLLDIVAAHAAADPLPAAAVNAADVRLHRRPDGRHVTAEQDFEIVPAPPACTPLGRQHRWIVQPLPAAPKLPRDLQPLRRAARTLREAREYILLQRAQARGYERGQQHLHHLNRRHRLREGSGA